MKVTVHCEGTPTEISKQLFEAASVYMPKTANATKPAVEAEEDAEETSEIDIAEIKAKRGRKAKKAEPEEEEELESDDAPEEDEADDEEEFDEEEEAEEEETLSESDLTKLKGALKAYSAKHDKTKAVAVLNKFAKRSDLVKPADLSKLLKALKV